MKKPLSTTTCFSCGLVLAEILEGNLYAPANIFAFCDKDYEEFINGALDKHLLDQIYVTSDGT